MATPAFEEIAETFDFLDDWEDRYRHVIELGKAMPAMDAVLQVPATKVEGCNNKIKVLKRVAYGYRDDAYFFLKIRAAFPLSLIHI